MVEDEDSKIRRNLIALCSVIVVLAWLRVPLDLVGERLLGVSTKSGFSLSAKRVWLAAFVLLAYFALRYRFCDEHQEGMKTIRTEYAVVERRILKRWLTWELACFSRFGWKTPLLGNPVEAIMDVRHARVADQSSSRYVRISLNDAALGGYSKAGIYVPSTRRGQAHLNYFARIDGADVPMPQEKVEFELTTFKRLMLSCATAVWLSGYSKASTSLLTPWALAVIAAVLTLRRLWQVW